MESVGEANQYQGMDQVNSIDTGSQVLRKLPLIIPALAEEDKQADTYPHDYE